MASAAAELVCNGKWCSPFVEVVLPGQTVTVKIIPLPCHCISNTLDHVILEFPKTHFNAYPTRESLTLVSNIDPRPSQRSAQPSHRKSTLASQRLPEKELLILVFANKISRNCYSWQAKGIGAGGTRPISSFL